MARFALPVFAASTFGSHTFSLSLEVCFALPFRGQPPTLLFLSQNLADIADHSICISEFFVIVEQLELAARIN
jgi:hypothetical protein